MEAHEILKPDGHGKSRAVRFPNILVWLPRYVYNQTTESILPALCDWSSSQAAFSALFSPAVHFSLPLDLRMTHGNYSLINNLAINSHASKLACFSICMVAATRSLVSILPLIHMMCKLQVKRTLSADPLFDLRITLYVATIRSLILIFGWLAGGMYWCGGSAESVLVFRDI